MSGQITAMLENGEHDPRIVIDWLGGNCPVQAEGKVNGVPFYFRARGDEWSLSIGDDPVDVSLGWAEGWHHEEPYGNGPFDAGWMPEAEARAFLIREATRFLAERDEADADDGQPDEVQEWADFDPDC